MSGAFEAVLIDLFASVLMTVCLLIVVAILMLAARAWWSWLKLFYEEFIQ